MRVIKKDYQVFSSNSLQPTYSSNFNVAFDSLLNTIFDLSISTENKKMKVWKNVTFDKWQTLENDFILWFQFGVEKCFSRKRYENNKISWNCKLNTGHKRDCENIYSSTGASNQSSHPGTVAGSSHFLVSSLKTSPASHCSSLGSMPFKQT